MFGELAWHPRLRPREKGAGCVEQSGLEGCAGCPATASAGRGRSVGRAEVSQLASDSSLCRQANCCRVLEDVPASGLAPADRAGHRV